MGLVFPKMSNKRSQHSWPNNLYISIYIIDKSCIDDEVIRENWMNSAYLIPGERNNDGTRWIQIAHCDIHTVLYCVMRWNKTLILTFSYVWWWGGKICCHLVVVLSHSFSNETVFY